MATNASPNRLRKKISNQKFMTSAYSVCEDSRHDSDGTDCEASRCGERQAVDEPLFSLKRQLDDERDDKRRTHRDRDDGGPQVSSKSERENVARQGDEPRGDRGGNSAGHISMLFAPRLEKSRKGGQVCHEF